MSDLKTISEELADRVKLSISVIGVGNAGNQVVARAFKRGYPVFAINSSAKDLSNEITNSQIPSFMIGKEGRGGGKIREVAQELMTQNGINLLGVNAFTSMVEASDVVFVVGSTAGGTGSGVAPGLCGMLQEMYPGKIIIYYGIIPKLADSVLAQSNTLTCIDEITKLEPAIPYMLADLSYYEDVSNDVAYADIGEHIINSIDVIAGKYLNYSENGMIDENDMRVIIGEPGYMSIYFLDKVTHQMVDKESIQSQMIRLIKHSPAVDIIHDGIVKELGVIVNCPNAMNEATKTGNYNELTSFIGTPFAIYENYSIRESVPTGQFITILSGQNLPYGRLSQLTAIVEAAREKFAMNQSISLDESVEKTDFISAQTSKARIALSQDEPARPDDAEAKDLLSKYFKK